MSNPETVWIEQDAIEKWWTKHRLELRQAVTVERVRLQEENEELKKQGVAQEANLMTCADEISELEKELKFVRAVVEKCTPNDYARTEAEFEQCKKELATATSKLMKNWLAYMSEVEETDKLRRQVLQLERMKGIVWKK